MIGDRLGDFTLEDEDVGDLAIVGLRPKMRVSARVDQLGVDAQMLAGTLDAAFEQMRDSELPADFVGVTRAARLVKIRRSAADYFEVSDFRQIRQNLLLDAGREVGVLRLGAKIFEWENGDALRVKRAGRWRDDVATDVAGGGFSRIRKTKTPAMMSAQISRRASATFTRFFVFL